MNIEIPDSKVIELCDAEKFIDALRIIGDKCGVSEVTYNKFGVVSFKFEDGSSIGGLRAFVDAGYVPKSALDPIK